MLHPEWLLLVGYIDSLFAERTERKDRPLNTLPDSFNQLYLQAMRHHYREAALLAWSGERWNPTPDWRLDRHVIRTALYLQERVGVKPGDRVAVVSELSTDGVIADLAALASGAVSVVVDPGLPADRLLGALLEAGARVIFGSGAALAKLDGGTTPLPGLSEVIALGSARGADGVRTFTQVLDLGGTLDTPERAQSLRAHVRSVAADHPAICHYDPSVQTRIGWEELTQGEVVERVGQLWRARPARQADRVYVATQEWTLAIRLALYACLGDGYSITILGTPGRADAELTDLGPHRIIARPSVLAEAARLAQTREQRDEKVTGGWRERATRVLKRGGERPEQRALREALGGRVRAIDPLGPLDPALAGRLQGIAAVGPELEQYIDVPG